MGLTADIELSLDDAGAIDFFEDHRDAFKAVAARSYAFANENVIPTGLPVRKDDAAAGLVQALKINQEVREWLAAKKLRQQHWYQRFADLILDRLWEELQREYTAAAIADGDGAS